MKRSDADVVSCLENGRANADGEEERAAYDRAADYVRMLASPPETVEELAERIRGLNERVEPIISIIPLEPEVRVSVGDLTMEVDAGDRGASLRAAWFAIVGMMGVERG